MKHLTEYITEKLRINTKTLEYKYFPKTKDELKKILLEKLDKDKNADLNDIDVSEITDMNKLFVGLDPHNITISLWDVSNVKDMSFMFSGCKNFNSDLSNWDVSNVKFMEYMFDQCTKLDFDLSKWNPAKALGTYKEFMFNGCISLEDKNKPYWYDETFE